MIPKKLRRPLSRVYRKIKKLVYSDPEIYLVYSMGKVGSAGVYLSLQRRKPYAAVFHVHFLSKNWLQDRLPKEHESFHSNISLGNDILKHIRKNPNKRIKIITLVREPVIRSISDLFQNWKHLYDDIQEVDNETLQEHVETTNYEYALEWFDSEFNEYLDLDVYSLPFDREKGYEIYNLDKCDILCMKLEALNKVGNQAMQEFLGEEFKLTSSNISSQKPTKDQYSYLKDHVKISIDKLNEVYGSKFVQHFYTSEEIADFKKRWSK